MSYTPKYPNDTFEWTDKVNGINKVKAEDVNSIARELIETQKYAAKKIELENKADAEHGHNMSDIEGLSNTLANKEPLIKDAVTAEVADGDAIPFVDADDDNTTKKTTWGILKNKVPNKRVARFIIGTSTAGWTEGDCDYLCDGTDDHVEINTAINTLPETGGEIIILDGTYDITASIHITKNNVSIRGNGSATILKRMYNSTETHVGDTSFGVITINGKSGCHISDLQIDGNKDNFTSSHNSGIYLYTSSNDNTITGNTCNNNRNGIYLYTSSNDNTITGNTCNNNRDGIRLYSSSNNNIIGNTCNNNSWSGIYLYLSNNNNTVTDNTCNNNGGGIRLNSSTDSIVANNICKSNIDVGIQINSSDDNVITGNSCNNNLQEIFSVGISLTGSSNNSITGNTCNNNAEGGIAFEDSSNNTITGNTCNNNAERGIAFEDSSNNTITGNTCNSNEDSGIILIGSSNNSITGNTCNNNINIGVFISSLPFPEAPVSKSNTVTGNTCNNNMQGIFSVGSSNNLITGNICNDNMAGIVLSTSNNNTITGNSCIRGTGIPDDYTEQQITIGLAEASNNLVSSNLCLGKALLEMDSTCNTLVNNKYE